MTGAMINLYKSKLPAEAFKSVQPQLLKWQESMMASYPSGPPRRIGGSPSQPSAPAKLSDGESKKKKDKPKLSDLDALLKEIKES